MSCVKALSLRQYKRRPHQKPHLVIGPSALKGISLHIQHERVTNSSSLTIIQSPVLNTAQSIV